MSEESKSGGGKRTRRTESGYQAREPSEQAPLDLKSTPFPSSEEPVREAPAPDPVVGIPQDATHPDAHDEDLLNVANIQGNILGGFNKDHQALVFLSLARHAGTGHQPLAQEYPTGGALKSWLREMIPFISTASEVIAFNRLFKSLRSRQRREPISLKSTWINIAFSPHGLEVMKKLDPTLDLSFEDQAFQDGMAKRSMKGMLGDPSGDDQRHAEAHPDNWVIGGNREELHLVVIIASDDPGELADKPGTTLHNLLKGHGQIPGMESLGKVKVQHGANLPAGKKLAGHEHFGFLDGVSQPGIRGRVSKDAHDVLTPRQNANNRDQGKPGHELIWPGEFVFGYHGGDPKKDFAEPGPISRAGPKWTDDGSFLVIRRLRQNVGLFHKFLNDVAKTHQVPAPPPQTMAPPQGVPVGDTAADLVGAKLVGRWRSGAPLMRTRNANASQNDQDNPAMAASDCANNNFEFLTAAKPLLPNPPESPFDCSDNNPQDPAHPFPPAIEDAKGVTCPFTGHIRKVYPRDDEAIDEPNSVKNAKGETIVLGEDDTQTHRILRRGIPYGPASDSTPANPKPDKHDKRPSGTALDFDRGLLFLCYQTSIEDQFEFITRNWVNNPDFKELSHPKNPATTQPGGFDPIIGQNNEKNAHGVRDRVREFNLEYVDSAGKQQFVRLSTATQARPEDRDWVITTGGEYFFAPSLKGLELLAK